QVDLWLKKIYGDRPIPTYEVNERTVDILYDLMERSEARDRDVSLLIEDMEDQKTAYKAETKEMQDILQNLGLSLDSLSRKATTSLSDLVRSAMILETKDTSLTSFFCAINNMDSELFEMESKNREIQQELNTLKKKLTSVLMMDKRILEDIKNIKKSQKAEIAALACQSSTMKFLSGKRLELKSRIRNVEEKLVGRGLNGFLTHKALVQLSE
ncbi:HAUS1 protein, partial [Scytalopus superciliaris]|nr:HAUS1 protein [Scytalopus superciliaris]